MKLKVQRDDGSVAEYDAVIASPEQLEALARASSPREVRRRALPRALAWGAASLALTLFLFWYFAKPGQLTLDIIGAAIPGAMTLVNLLELASGVPLSEWEKRWATLSGAKKFLLSLAVLFTAFLIFAVISLTLVLTHLV